MGDLLKRPAQLNIFDPIMHHGASGHFESSRKGKRGEFKDIAGGMKGMSKQAIRDYRARQKARGSFGGLMPSTPLTSRYS